MVIRWLGKEREKACFHIRVSKCNENLEVNMSDKILKWNTSGFGKAQQK